MAEKPTLARISGDGDAVLEGGKPLTYESRGFFVS
jgi:hypothetical protein